MFPSDAYPIDHKITVSNKIWIVTVYKGSKWWKMYDPNLDLKPDLYPLNYSEKCCQDHIKSQFDSGKLRKILLPRKVDKWDVKATEKIYPCLVALIHVSERLYQPLNFHFRLELAIERWTSELVYWDINFDRQYFRTI